MREILFRGKRVDNGEWVYGFYTLYGQSRGLSPAIITGTEEGCVIPVFIDPETRGEYTGLTDKNGVKIFEGDLLNGFQYPFLNLKDNVHNYFAEVVWLNDCSAFGLYTHKHPLSAVNGISEGDCGLMQDFYNSQWEVIGNIHDNPELLEE